MEWKPSRSRTFVDCSPGKIRPSIANCKGRFTKSDDKCLDPAKDDPEIQTARKNAAALDLNRRE
jgi:hypothetical protein